MKKDFVRTGRPPQRPAVCGTKLRYVHGCRCEDCRLAYCAGQKETRERLKAGRGDYVVSAEFAREHLKRLSRAGVGSRTVAEYTATQPQYIQKIRNGQFARIRMSTEARIMRVRPDMLADHAAVPVGESRRLVAEMNAAGFTKQRLAVLLGYAGEKLQFLDGPRISVRNAARVKRLHQKLVVNRVERMVGLASLTRCA
jgi:hypothetical protein